MICNWVQNRILPYEAHELGGFAAGLVKRHLATCSGCRAAAAELRGLAAASRAMLFTEVEPPQGCEERVMEAVQSVAYAADSRHALLPRAMLVPVIGTALTLFGVGFLGLLVANNYIYHVRPTQTAVNLNGRTIRRAPYDVYKDFAANRPGGIREPFVTMHDLCHYVEKLSDKADGPTLDTRTAHNTAIGMQRTLREDVTEFSPAYTGARLIAFHQASVAGTAVAQLDYTCAGRRMTMFEVPDLNMVPITLDAEVPPGVHLTVGRHNQLSWAEFMNGDAHCILISRLQFDTTWSLAGDMAGAITPILSVEPITGNPRETIPLPRRLAP